MIPFKDNSKFFSWIKQKNLLVRRLKKTNQPIVGETKHALYCVKCTDDKLINGENIFLHRIILEPQES